MKTRAKQMMVAAGVVAAPLVVAFVVVIGIPLYRYWGPKPSVPALQAQGQKLVDAVERYRANHGDYPPSLEAAGAFAPDTGYGRWEYGREPDGSYYLKVGDYGLYNFVMWWDDRNKRWRIDS